MWWGRRGIEEPIEDEEFDWDLTRMDTDTLAGSYSRGQVNAFGEIWRRHYGRMRAMAREELGPFRALSRLYEPDDALCDVAGRMIERALAGDWADEIACGNDFWRFFHNVLRQCIRDEQDRLSAIKRGGEGSRKSPPGRPRRRTFFGRRPSVQEEEDTLDLIASKEPTPEVIAMTEDLIARLFDRLDDGLRLVASLRLSNRPVPLIAEETGLSERTVARRLKEIRRIWKRSGLLD